MRALTLNAIFDEITKPAGYGDPVCSAVEMNATTIDRLAIELRSGQGCQWPSVDRMLGVTLEVNDNLDHRVIRLHHGDGTRDLRWRA